MSVIRRIRRLVRWANGDADPKAFLSRHAYGAYVVQRLGDAIRGARAKLRVVRGEAVAIDDKAVELADGTRLPAEVVVLATGLAPRLVPSTLPADPRIIDAWDECALAALPRDGKLLVLGAGLTALDVVAYLDAHGFAGSVSIVSRRGLLPRPDSQVIGRVDATAASDLATAPGDLGGLLHWTRAYVRACMGEGASWQQAIDSLRPSTGQLWRGLSPADRARFVRRIRPYWDVLRHRAPPDTHDLVERWRASGRLELRAGSVAACVPREAGLDVELDLGGGTSRVRFDAIVRCIGPALDRSESDTPLVRDLIASGLATPDPAGLGIVTDEDGRVVAANGRRSSRLFALGAPCRASSWETTAVPDIARHAHALARRLVLSESDLRVECAPCVSSSPEPPASSARTRASG